MNNNWSPSVDVLTCKLLIMTSSKSINWLIYKYTNKFYLLLNKWLDLTKQTLISNFQKIIQFIDIQFERSLLSWQSYWPMPKTLEIIALYQVSKASISISDLRYFFYTTEFPWILFGTSNFLLYLCVLSYIRTPKYLEFLLYNKQINDGQSIN